MATRRKGSVAAVPRKRSLSERLRGLFQGRNGPKVKLISTPDYDEAPQRHMMEANRQIAKASSRSFPTTQKRGKRNCSTEDRVKCPGNKRPCGVFSGKEPLSHTKGIQPKPITDATTRAAASTDQACISDAATTQRRSLPPVSPLDLFYHNFIASYDTRMPKHTTKGGVEARKSVERKVALKHSKQLCSKKSSKDNTIGSIDSIHSEEALADLKGQLADDDDTVLLTSEKIEARERQFVTGTFKRSCLKMDGWQLSATEGNLGEKGPLLIPENQPLMQGSLSRSGEFQDAEAHKNLDDTDAKQNCAKSIPQTDGAIEIEHSERDESDLERKDDAYVRSLAHDVRTSSPILPVCAGSTPSSQVLTLSMSVRDDVSKEDFPSPIDEDTSDAVNMSAHIESASLNMKRTRENFSVSGKYAQVVVIHSPNKDMIKTSEDLSAGSSSAVATTEEDKAQDWTRKHELTARTARDMSFNICGENVYITIGSSRTKIKAYRRKKGVRAHSAGVTVHGGAIGSENIEKSAALPSKKKKLEKKLKKKHKPLKKCDEVKNTRKKTDAHRPDDPCSSVTYTKITNNFLVECLDVENENMKLCGNSPSFTIKTNENAYGKVFLEDICNDPSLNEQHGVRSLDISPSLSDDVFSKRPMYVGDNTLDSEESVTMQKSIMICKSPCNDYEKVGKGEANELTHCHLDEGNYSPEKTEDDWVVITINSSGQLLDTEVKDMGEIDSPFGPIDSNQTPETMELAAISLQIYEDNNKDNLEDDIIESEEHENSIGTEMSPPQYKADKYVNKNSCENSHINNVTEGIVEKQTTHDSSSSGSSRSSSSGSSSSCQNVDEIEYTSETSKSDAVSMKLNFTRADPNHSSDTGTDQAVNSQPAKAVSRSEQSAANDQRQTFATVGASAAAEDAAEASAEEDESRDVVVDGSFVDVFALKKAWFSQNRTLKRQITRYRERSNHVIRLQQLIGQLERETAEMRKMLQVLDGQTNALRNEASEMRCTLSAVCDVSVTDLCRTTEARSLEPACFRRYTNIRTPQDAANLLSAVRSRMKALGELEILVYRKQLVLHHVLPSSTQERLSGPKKVLRAIHKGPKPKKTDEASAKKGSIVIEVVSPSIESGVATPSWSDEVTNTESPITTSAPFSESVEGETSPPVYQMVDVSHT